MNKIEVVVKALADGDLRQNRAFESGVDRIGALAHCDLLGAAIVRLMASHSQSASDGALALLVRRVRPKSKMYQRAIYERVCRVAIKEWIIRDRHSDAERMRDIGIDPKALPKWAPVFAKAHREISDAVDRVKRELPCQLYGGRH